MAAKSALKRVLMRALPEGGYKKVRGYYRNLRNVARLAGASMYDMRCFVRGSGLMGHDERDALKAHILKSYHRIEKGLALPVPKPGFGADAVRLLLDDLDVYTRRFGVDWVVGAALQTLDEYLAFNGKAGADVAWVDTALRSLRARIALGACPPGAGGTIQIRREDVLRHAGMPFEDFAKWRHSVRQFAAQPVDDALIEQAASIARYAPSVCNRSGGMVYSISDPARAKELLKFQNGNRGFGDTAGRILVITARQAVFHTVGERYQCWIDGGLFGMSLIYALHSLGLGTCCLNWSVEPQTDRAFKKAAGIPPDDAVIMLLAVGHLPETLAVARSERRPLGEVLVKL